MSSVIFCCNSAHLRPRINIVKRNRKKLGKSLFAECTYSLARQILYQFPPALAPGFVDTAMHALGVKDAAGALKGCKPVRMLWLA